MGMLEISNSQSPSLGIQKCTYMEKVRGAKWLQHRTWKKNLFTTRLRSYCPCVRWFSNSV